jgi:hypothetical protein
VANGTVPGVQRSAKTAIRRVMVERGGAFTVLRRPRAIVDVIGRLRYLGAQGTLDASFELPGRRFARRAYVAECGHRERIRRRAWPDRDDARRPLVPFYLDAGTGSSKVTWQAMTGLGYVMKWADVRLAYRCLACHGSNDQLMQTVRMSGPSPGATVRF